MYKDTGYRILRKQNCAAFLMHQEGGTILFSGNNTKFSIYKASEYEKRLKQAQSVFSVSATA